MISNFKNRIVNDAVSTCLETKALIQSLYINKIRSKYGECTFYSSGIKYLEVVEVQQRSK